MAEIEFNALGEQCLNRGIPDAEMLSREVAAWVERRNGVESGGTGSSPPTTPG